MCMIGQHWDKHVGTEGRDAEGDCVAAEGHVDNPLQEICQLVTTTIGN